MSDSETRLPTDEQQAVIEADDSSLTVIASAGAGKTFVLVERYLRHVEREGIGADHILTITFTKKAAAEMKERIVQRLRTGGHLEQAQIAETGPIQTIHSFCERLLRENSLEAGLDPKFDILSESQTSRLLKACVREVLASDLEEEPDGEALIRFLAGKRRGFGDDRSPYGILESAIERVLQSLRSGPHTRDQICDWYSGAAKLRTHWEDAIARELAEDVRKAFDRSDQQDFNLRLQQSYKEAGLGVPSWAKGRSDPVAEEESLRQSCGLVQLACAAWWRLDREMNKLQALDFAALEIRADRLMERSEVTAKRLRDQYKIVMVDESQDVNPIQYRLLDKLGARRIMMVGDAQQSIYGFRQADVRLFKRRAESTETRRLSKNWRSLPGILNFVDVVFSRIWGADYVPMQLDAGPMDFESDAQTSFEGVEVWKQAPKNYSATAGYVQQLLDEGAANRDIAILVRDSSGALATKKALDDKEIPNRIVGGSEKFYTRLEVRDLANTLRSLADPFDDFALLATLRSPMAGISLDSVAVLGLKARDTKTSVIELLESFEPPLVEDIPRLWAFLAWFMPLKACADRLSAWEVLAEVYAQSDYLPALARRPKSEQMLANARKLLTLATMEPELGPLEYAERIREIQDLRHKEGDAPADDSDADLVKIMTIHKAKGLEWPIVILPQTDKPIVGRAGDFSLDPTTGMVATKFGKGQALMNKLLTYRQKSRDEAEEKRVLYVGLTRAKSRLCICLVPATATQSVSKLLSGLMEPEQMQGLRIRDTFAAPGPPV